MRTRHTIAIFLTLALISSTQSLASHQKRTKIAFGSCQGLLSDRDTDIFKVISRQVPEMFIWLGDAVHLDYWIPPFRLFYMHPDKEHMKATFDHFKETDRHYKLLVEDNRTKITGI